jgi:putative transposase
MAVCPKSSWPWVRALLHSVYDQPDAASVHAQFDRVLDALIDKLPEWPSTSRAPGPTCSRSPPSP